MLELDPALLGSLRSDLASAGFYEDAVSRLLGAGENAARQRGVFVPAKRVLAQREHSPLATLTRLFLLGEPVSSTALDDAMPQLGARGALELSLVVAARQEDEALRAAVSLNPVRLRDPRAREDGTADFIDWWLLSDLDDQLRSGPARPDHVMGMGGATRSLLSMAPFGEVGKELPESALDLGSGCGVIAMFLATMGVPRVIGIDISRRALTFAHANALLNGLEARVEFRQGDLFTPVLGERFEVILSNPPFVITPRGDEQAAVYEYRDGGMAGDALAERVILESPAHLTDGGTLLCLANWETPWGGDGLERVQQWIADAAVNAGCALDAWVIERDRIEPLGYAELWARDGGARAGDAEYDRLLAAWLDDFAARRVVSVGLGSIRLRRRSNLVEGLVRAEAAPGGLAAHGLGAALERSFHAGVWAAAQDDAELLATCWVRAPRVVEEREYQPGAADPSALRLVIDTPIGRRIDVDPLLAAALGASDGDLTLGQLSDALASLFDVDAAACATELSAGFRELAWLGMVTPADG